MRVEWTNKKGRKERGWRIADKDDYVGKIYTALSDPRLISIASEIKLLDIK